MSLILWMLAWFGLGVVAGAATRYVRGRRNDGKRTIYPRWTYHVADGWTFVHLRKP